MEGVGVVTEGARAGTKGDVGRKDRERGRDLKNPISDGAGVGVEGIIGGTLGGWGGNQKGGSEGEKERKLMNHTWEGVGGTRNEKRDCTY